MPDTNTSSVVLMQFAKWPEEGRVKTRLMPLLGPAGACEAHITLSLTVLENLCSTGYLVQFWWDRSLEPAPEEAMVILNRLEAAGSGIEQRFQSGVTLGHRMLAAMSESLESCDYALVIGSDCPSVAPDYIHQAVKALASYDIVLGPSDDGGYVLIGARRVIPGMLDGIAWGTAGVLEQTQRRLNKLGLRVHLLEPLWDVDEPEDWQRFQRVFRR